MEFTLNQINLTNVRITTVFAAVAAGSMTIFYQSLPPGLPMLYTLPWGENQIVSKSWLWALPIIIVLSGFVSVLFISKIKLERLLLYMWLGTVWVFQAILMLATVRIIWLVL